MKKGNRLLAGFLVLVLVMTSIVWDFDGVSEAKAESSNTTTSTHEKYDFMNMNDISVLDADFTSYLQKGSADQKVSDRWFVGKTGTGAVTSQRAGLKPKQQNQWSYLVHNNTYENYMVSLSLNPDANLCVVVGDVNTEASPQQGDGACMFWFSGSSVKNVAFCGAGKATNTSTLKWSTATAAITLNIRVENRTLTAWVEEMGVSTSFTVNTAFPEQSQICLMQKRNGNGGQYGAYKSLEIRNLDAEGYTDFRGADTTVLDAAGFTSTKFNKNTKAIVGTSKQEVSTHWFTGSNSSTPYNGVSGVLSKNPGIKSRSLDSAKEKAILNTPYSTYTNFQISAEIYYGVSSGILLGNQDTYPTSTSDSVMVYFNGKNIQLYGGALDYSSKTLTGGGGWSDGYKPTYIYRFRKNSTDPMTYGAVYNLNIKMEDGLLTIWVEGYESKLKIEVSETFAKSANRGKVALMNDKFDGDGGGIKSLTYQRINLNIGTTVDNAGYTDFDRVNVSLLDEKGFSATRFDTSNSNAIVGQEQPVATYWAVGDDVLSNNNGIKPNTKEADKKKTTLNTPYKYDNYRVSAEVYWGSNTGIVLGEKNVLPTSSSYTSVVIYFNNDQIQLVGGGLDYSMVYAVDGASWNTGYAPTYIYKPSSAFTKTAGNVYTLNAELVDGVLTVWVDGYDGKVSIEVADTFKNDSIALIGRNYDNDGGGFKSLTVTELTASGRPTAVQAQAGEGFTENFPVSDTSFKIADLDSDFSAYYFAKDSKESSHDRVFFRWDDTTTGLKPKHNAASGARTMLTYDRLLFKNVEITAFIEKNWIDNSIMIAPQGEIATVDNGGIKIWVESKGNIRISGAIDAGTASAAGGYVKVLGQNMVSGYTNSEYDTTKAKPYKLHVKIDGGVLYAWMDEYSEHVISVNVTDDYKGGVVSLYATGNNSGGFTSFSAVELDSAALTTPSYEQSFNTINSLDELTDFIAYRLDSVESTPQEVEISDLFRLTGGRLQSLSAANGEKDRTNFSILTLKNKEYKNFELTLKYEQARMQRYGIMFGTELGEFAYSLSNSRLSGNGGAYVYTEAEGYRNVRGSMYASSYTKASEALHRETGKPDSFWWYNNDVMNNVQQKTLHTMTIRVVGDGMTMIIDNDESTRVTVRLDDYDGGYISLVSDAAGGDYGAFTYFAIEELTEDAKLEVTLPELSDGFETLKEVDEIFDAYYLSEAKKSSKLEKVKLKEHWWLNNEGFLARAKSASGYSVIEDVEVLTYTKEKFTDFEMTYTFQQNWLRLGVMLGEDLGEYALSYKDGKLTADKGALYYLEAEGYSNAQGYLNNWTDKDNMKYRVNKFAPVGFKDATGNVTANIGAKKEHLVKVVVKDKQLYVFIDGNEEEAVLHVFLGDHYKGGYVSLIAHSASGYGFNHFSITDKVTTKLPTGKGTSTSGNIYTVDFDTTKLDISQFETYYLAKTKGNTTGAMAKDTFEDQWTLDNGHLESNNQLTAPSSKNLEEFEYDDSTKVSVLTYKKKLTDFVVSYDYQKTPQRLMFMFGAEMGKFALAAPHTTQKAQGVLIYPENDLGVSGGLVALGNLATYNSSMRPLNRQKVSVDGYHIKDQWTSNVGTWHTMTVAVINGHCYVYLDDYGMIADYELTDYDGGYISLATTGRSGGFDNLKITDLSTLSENDIIAVENPSDITVLVGTDASALGLPTTVKATTKTGKTVDVPVTWKSLNYHASEAGIYQFTAVLDDKTNVGAKINIRVVTEMPKTQSGVKYWTFDTEDDLKDFQTTYLKNAETGYIKEGVPNWYVSSSGKLTRDQFRAVNGDPYKELAILTYKGEKYTNFELEVEYTQQWQRMMVLFGSEKVGQYIDLKDIYAASNPVAGFVEMEGTRNFIGNLINANFDSNDKEKINNARESGIRLDNYYDKVLSGGNQGKKHTMKIRVVGDQAMMWVDNCEVPYVCTLTNYDGGYISLVATSKSGSFDNLKITRLGATPVEAVKEPNMVANGTMNVSIDETASTELVIPEKVKPDSFDDVDTSTETKLVIPMIAYVVGGTTVLLAAVIGGLFILTALKKKKKENS